jgi:hypothetical protein
VTAEFWILGMKLASRETFGAAVKLSVELE